MSQKLSKKFYQNNDALALAQHLIGKTIVTNIDNIICKGIIIETEAYSFKEKACHAYNNLRTNRTEPMFAEGGIAYVYLCYGLHFLFNVVCNEAEIAEAVLIRAVKPSQGIDHIKERRKRIKDETNLCNGPAKFSQAFGINLKHNKIDLTGNTIWIEDDPKANSEIKIEASKRIGIDYAEEDKDLLWRVCMLYMK